MMKRLIFLVVILIGIDSNAQLFVPKLISPILLEEEDYPIDFSPSYLVCKKGIKSISYVFVGSSNDSVSLFKSIEKNRMKSQSNHSWDSPITIYYNPEGYLVGGSSEKNDNGYRYITTKDSLLLVGCDYRYSYPLDNDGISKEYLRINDYNVKIADDTIYVFSKMNCPQEQTIKYIFTLRDSLYRGKDLIIDSTSHIIQRHFYDNNNMRIKTINFTSQTGMSKNMILYHFNEEYMLVSKERFENEGGIMVKKVQYFYGYDNKENLSYVFLDTMSVRPGGSYRYRLYSFDYKYFSKRLGKQHKARFDNGQRLFFNPDY